MLVLPLCCSVDPFTKKDWYDVKAPSMFNIRQIGKTLVSRTVGTKIASDGLKGRVYEVSLADLQNDEIAFRKFKLICDDVQGKNCLTNFYGMSSSSSTCYTSLSFSLNYFVTDYFVMLCIYCKFQITRVK